MALACLAVAVVAGTAAHAALVRGPTAAQRSAAAATAVTGRWHTWAAGRIFPATLSYSTSLLTTETADRAGIAPGSGCAAALDSGVVALADRDRCQAGLRATYTGQLQGILYTVGVLAFPSPRQAAAAGVAAAGGLGQQVRAADTTSLRAIGVPAAWRVSRGRGVLVGVLDTGVNAHAPDLTGSVTTGPDYTVGADPAGYQPPHLHGTYIASLIAGHGSGPGRSQGVVGVAPQARILSVRVLLDDQEPGFEVYNLNASYYNALALGIRYAVQHGATVLNASLGSTTPTRSGTRAYFSDRNSSVVVSAPRLGVAVGVAGVGLGVVVDG
ncbi:MAG TPA: S8 family serine peptidase [Streptosporangiaceae bacterium]